VVLTNVLHSLANNPIVCDFYNIGNVSNSKLALQAGQYGLRLGSDG
jgi:hypothetical protein